MDQRSPLGIEYLGWQARRRGLDFASFVNPVFLTPTASESLDFGWDGGVRVGLGYRFASCWDVGWSFTHFGTDDSGAVSSTDRPGDVLIVTRSLVSRGLLDQAVDAVEADAEVEYDVNDIEVGRSLSLNDSLGMRLFGGFRWAMIDQDFNTRYTYRDAFGQTAEGTINSPTEMDAYGIRLGAEASWMTRHGLRLFGRGAGSVLVGTFESYILEVDEVEGTIVDFPDRFTQAVPVLEAAAGAAWSQGPWEVSGGYELNTWFNMAESNRASQDLLFDGFFVRLAYTR